MQEELRGLRSVRDSGEYMQANLTLEIFPSQPTHLGIWT